MAQGFKFLSFSTPLSLFEDFPHDYHPCRVSSITPNFKESKFSNFLPEQMNIICYYIKNSLGETIYW